MSFFDVPHLCAAQRQRPRESTEQEPQFECIFLSASVPEFETVVRLIKPARIQVHHAATVEQADFLFTVTEARVLLADTVFPDGAWPDAKAMLDKAHRRVALVLAADAPDEGFWVDVLEQGVYDLVVKPFQAEELRRVLENANAHARWEAPSHGARLGGAAF